MTTLHRIAFVFVIPALLILSACSSDEPVLTPTPFVQLSPVSPPDTPFEEALRPNDPMTEIWRPGYWKYDGINFTWEPGYLMPRPSPTSVWAADHWEKRTYGWAFIKGYWQ